MANTTTQNLVAFLLADSSIAALVATRIYIGHVPQASTTPYIYVAKRAEEPWDDIDAIAYNPFREIIAVECWGDAGDVFGTTGLGHLVRVRCQGYAGTIGTGTVQRIEVVDADDDYAPRGSSGDEGLDFVVLDLTITNYQASLT